MGNNHGSGPHSKSGDSTPTSSGSRRSSKPAPHEHDDVPPPDTPSQLLPVEKLSKVGFSLNINNSINKIVLFNFYFFIELTAPILKSVFSRF